MGYYYASIYFLCFYFCGVNILANADCLALSLTGFHQRPCADILTARCNWSNYIDDKQINQICLNHLNQTFQ